MATAEKQRVVVIGAGYAGLCAARHLKDKFEVTVLERQNDVGGLWNYDPETGVDEHGLPRHGSIYENLWTNFPRQIMDFPDFPNRAGNAPSFTHRDSVLEFLKQYASHFNLWPCIRFNSYVTSVVRTKSEMWEVDWLDLVKGDVRGTGNAARYHKVFICSGHFSTPDVPPNAEGTTEFDGSIMHSHNYRTPEPFDGQKVAVIGAGPSGVDIAIDVASCAEEVFLCYSNKDLHDQKFPENVHIAQGRFESFEGGSVVLDGGQLLAVDSVIFCTGYKFSFPFLKYENVQLKTDDNRVTPLYKEIFHIKYPDSLFLIGLQRQTPLGYLADAQMRFLLRMLERGFEQFEMTADEEREFKRRMDLGVPKRKVHKLGHINSEGKSLFRDYIRDLETTAGLGTLVPEVVLAIFEDVVKKDVSTLRKLTYTVLDDRHFGVI